MNNTDYLRHYGILGMKWGTKRSKTTSKNTNKQSKMARATSITKAIWKDLTPANKAKLVIGGVMTGVAVVGAMKDAGILGKKMYKDAKMGRTVTYKVLNEVGGVIFSGKTGVL